MQNKKPFIRILSVALCLVLSLGVMAALAACPPKLVEYTINYQLNDGTNHVDNPTTYTTNDFPLTLREPTRPGHTFEGWTSEVNSEKTVVLTIRLGQEQNLNLVAHWVANGGPGTIAYRLDGGTNHASNPYEFTEADVPLTISGVPTRTGYDFKGWTTAGSTEKKMEVEITEYDDEGVILTAHWSKAMPANYGADKKIAPDFTLKNLQNEDVSLSDYRGEKTVLILFWTYWCDNCKTDIDNVLLPFLNGNSDLKNEVEILFVHVLAGEKNDPNGLSDIIAKKNGAYDKLNILKDDGAIVYVGNDYNAGGLPVNYVVDKWGYLYSDGIPANRPISNFNQGRITSFTEFSKAVNGAINRAEGY